MVILNGNDLDLIALRRIAVDREKVRISAAAAKRISQCWAYLKRRTTENKVIYGFNTGFGALSHVRIGTGDLRQLQKNILRSHHAGVGDFFAPEFVRAAISLRVNSLAKGNSGVSPDLTDRLVSLLNNNIIPAVPKKGSVGASGDLAPMAAIGLVLIGEGKVLRGCRTIAAARALTKHRMRPMSLCPKEGLALINGTQFSTAIAALLNEQALYICDLADHIGAMSLDALRGSIAPFDRRVFDVRPYPGAIASAKKIRNAIKGSQILASHRNCRKVQDPYSLRCMAQVHGAARDIFVFSKRTLETEMNSATDNPLIFPDRDLILSNGNFHGEPVAFVLDMMAIALSELASISERRVFRLLDSKLSGLNPFLSRHPGLNSGFMMTQVTAASLVSQNKILSHPASVDSIPTSANQEDHVSMSMNAGLKALEILENTKYVLAIELVCASQAIDLLKPIKTSNKLESIKRKVRQTVPFLDADQPVARFIENARRLIDQRALL